MDEQSRAELSRMLLLSSADCGYKPESAAQSKAGETQWREWGKTRSECGIDLEEMTA